MSASVLLEQFSLPLLNWYIQNGRKNLPWKYPVDPYRIWLSEIMLQQTQVKTVIPYFLRFIESFPNIDLLAQATEDDVLALWSGLGYYSRGRRLHQTAKIIYNEYQGQFPQDIQSLIKLSGIGASTAAAIASQAYNQPTPILDGNVKRILSRYFMIEGFSSQTTQRLWQLADQCMSREHPADYTQAIMDLGAICCTVKNPRCDQCPLQQTCLAKINGMTANYPNKKPKKIIPHQTQQFLLIYSYASNDKVREPLFYLEKRPPSGIWGGLWCPPSIHADEDSRRYIQNNFAFDVIAIHPLINIKHTFTHLKLFMKGLSIEVARPVFSLEKKTGWFSSEETTKLGLAKPIRAMISELVSVLAI